jgi:hypothetical protein
MSWISAVLILPADLRDAGNALSVAMGHGSTYKIPLAPPESAEPTHYGTHSMVSTSFQEMIEAAKLGEWPEHFTPEMIALAEPVVAALITSFVPDGEAAIGERLPSVAAAHGLTQHLETPDLG